MMMVRSRSHNTVTRAIVAGAVVVLVVLGVLFGSTIRDVVVMLLYTEDSSDAYRTLTRDALIERLEIAESEISRVRYQAILFDVLADDLATLRSEVRLRPVQSYASARVVGAPPMTHYDTLVVASGERDGVLVGDIASVYGVAVGVVAEVGERSSVVALYSTPGAVHDASLGDPPAIVSARGLGGGSFETTVPDEVAVSPGDIVRDQKTGLPFAIVSAVEKREIDTSATVRMALAVSPSTVTVVSLIHPEL